MTRDSLGAFEQLVLLACLRLGEGAYTLAVADEIERRTGREASHAAVYVALRRMEAKGWVASRLGEGPSERGGRPRRYFAVEDVARVRLHEARDELLTMWDGVEGWEAPS